MPTPARPWRDPTLRSMAIATALGGALSVGSTFILQVSPWLAVAMGWAIALVSLRNGYVVGWCARSIHDLDRTAGRWMAYPVDEDGVPTTAPVSGRLVVDEPQPRRL